MAHGVPSARIAFVLALFPSAAGLPTIHAQEVVHKPGGLVIHQHDGFIIFESPAVGPNEDRPILHVGVKVHPGKPAYRFVANFRGESGGRDAEEDDDLTQTSEARLYKFTGTIRETADQFVFRGFDCGPGNTEAQAEKQLYNLLSKKIALVNQTCNLTDVQKLKIELAGRGDVTRLLDRARRLKKRFEQYAQVRTADEIEEWATEVAPERERLQILLGSGMFGDDTLFQKVLMTVLTPEQVELLRE